MQTGIGKTQLRYIIREAKKRGYDPDKSLTLKDEYFHDGYRSGRPMKLSEEQAEALIAASKPKEGERRRTNAQLAREFGISERTVRRLKEMEGGFKKSPYRPQRKDFPATVTQARALASGEVDAPHGGQLMMPSAQAEDNAAFEASLMAQLQNAGVSGLGYEGNAGSADRAVQAGQLDQMNQFVPVGQVGQVGQVDQVGQVGPGPVGQPGQVVQVDQANPYAQYNPVTGQVHQVEQMPLPPR